jgi:3D-(3,5/4)-trihydroxycyclohexane-1,2-dione acylhydrolase (decyclizing)
LSSTSHEVLIEQSENSANGSDSDRLTVAQALVRYLQAQYSSRDGERQRLIPGLFGIFGHGNVAGLSQALCEQGSGLPHYQPFNEQSMVHTAAGFAKATNRRATFACAASIGPGARNMVTGAALATINRLPVLLLPADYYASRRQGQVLQQLEHPVSSDTSVNDCLRPVSRMFDRIIRPEQLLEALPEAMRVLTDPAETGAVTISLPQDVQSEAASWPRRFFEPRVWELERRPPLPERIDEALKLLGRAERPLLIAGGGVNFSEAWIELAEFAELFGVPVTETSAGKGSFRGRAELQLGGLGVSGTPLAGTLARRADLVICVGTRLTDFSTGSRTLFQNPGVRFVSINVVSHDAHKLRALPVLADAREALRALISAGRTAGAPARDTYQAQVRECQAAWGEQLESAVKPSDGELTQPQLVRLLNQAAQPGDTVIAASGSAPADLLQMWDCSGGRNAHIEFGFSCMGYEIPASLGVRMAQPRGEVYTFIGDGAYLMNPTELATAVQEGLKITVILSRNGGYQCIRDLQRRSSGQDFGNEFRRRDPATGRLEGEFLEIDFAANARSLGTAAWSVCTAAELESALADARDTAGPCLIQIDTDREVRGPSSSVWWDVAPAEVSADSRTRAARAEYDRRRRLQRYHG